MLYSKQQMQKKRQKPSQQMKNPFGERICAQGSVPRLNQPFVFGWNINWCLHLYSPGSGEQLCTVNHFIFRVMVDTTDVWSREVGFYCVFPAWNTAFGILNDTICLAFLSKAHFSSTTIKYTNSYSFFIVMGKWFPAQKRNNRNSQPFVSLSHSCLVFTADVEVIALNSSANFPT